MDLIIDTMITYLNVQRGMNRALAGTIEEG